MRANSWLYHFYLVQTKLQYGMNYEGQQQPQQQASTSRSSASASSPGGAYGYSHLMNNTSPVPSSSCSASGDTSNTPQPVHFQLQQQQQPPQHLVPPPLNSPLYAPPPPSHHHHPHNHLYPSPVMDTYQHFSLHPQQQQQQHHHQQQQQQQQHQIHPQGAQSGSSNTGSSNVVSSNPHFSFAPSPSSGHHHSYSGVGGPFSLGQETSPYHSGHQQLQQHIKTESFHSDLGDRAELGGYHVSFIIPDLISKTWFINLKQISIGNSIDQNRG